MRILIATDAFPPVCGGSGWSTYELARGLRSRGHHVVVVQTHEHDESQIPVYDGFGVIGYRASAPPVPFVRNYLRNERLYPRLGAFLSELIDRERIDLVHAQHVLTGPASVIAARAARVPSVCTVRDYWPMCYWGDLIQDVATGSLCPGCSASAMSRCIRPRTGRAWPMATPAIPYMRANLRLKQHTLSQADAVVAVSHKMADMLRERAELGHARVETIPNAVDVARLRAQADGSPPPLDRPYALFVGKLAPNKGVDALVDVIAHAGLDIPLVVIGEGPERRLLEEAASRTKREILLLGWLDREAVFQWLRHARLLVFPSGWLEPLSRVLLEASALGVPIAATDTGGTSDILIHEETALLSRTNGELTRSVARLAGNAELRERLGSAARLFATSHFDTPVVMERMERLYLDVLEQFHRRAGT